MIVESKKRWLALIMAMIMLISLLPDSFLSAVKVWAENSGNNENIVTIKFSADEELNSDDFSFTLYELTDTDAEYEDTDKELTSTDGKYLLPVAEKKPETTNTDARKAKTLNNSIDVNITKENNDIQVQLKGLSEGRQYVYELRNIRKKYFICTDMLNINNVSNQNIEKKLQEAANENKINFPIAQNISENPIVIKYNIYPMIKVKTEENTEHIFQSHEVSSGEIQNIENGKADNEIEFPFDSSYYNYKIEFYRDENDILEKSVFINYNEENKAYQLADNEDNSVLLESNQVDIFLQFFKENKEAIAEDVEATINLYPYNEDTKNFDETPVIQSSSVNLKEQISLGTLKLPLASKYKIKAEITNKDSIYKTNQEFEQDIKEEDIKKPEVGNKAYTFNCTLQEKKQLTLEFIDEVKNNNDIVKIRAESQIIKISINNYIKSLEEGTSLTCESTNLNGNGTLEKTGNTCYLSINPYFTGEIEIQCKLEKTDCISVEKTLSFQVSYGEIENAEQILPKNKDENGKEIIYSNQEGYKPKIQAESGRGTFYAIKRSNPNTVEKITKKTTELADNIILLPENTDIKEIFYDIYEIKENKIYHSEFSLKADTVAPFITAEYQQTNSPIEYNSQKYYQNRTLQITLQNENLENDTDIEKFYQSLALLIKSVTYEDDENKSITYNSQQLTLNFNKDSDSFINVEENGVSKTICKISKWNKEKKQCNISFIQSGTYEINTDTEYTDAYGNKAAISFSGDDQQSFILDNTAPTADCKILIRKYEDTSVSLCPVGEVSKFITTSVGNPNVPVKTSLENITDKLSGIKEVKCIVSESPIQNSDLKAHTDWTDSVTAAENKEYTIETKIDNTDASKSFCIVTFTDKEISKKYYVYYKAVDNAGNENYFNELGFILDNKAPEIALQYSIEEDNTVKTVKGEINKTFYFNNDITVLFEITDENIQIDENGNILGIDVKINNAEFTNINWALDKENSDKIIAKASHKIQLDKNNVKTYEIEVQCKDKVGISTYHKETLIIDKVLPEIKKYEFYDTNNTLLDTISSQKENIVQTVVGNNLNTDVKVKLQISEDTFNKDGVDIKVKNLEGTFVSVTLENTEWNNSNNIYENYITVQTKDGEEAVYQIELTCTDKAGNTRQYTETLVIDKKAPIIEIQYENNAENNDEGKPYYKKRAAIISINEPYSFDKDVFIDAFINALGLSGDEILNLSKILNISDFEYDDTKKLYKTKVTFIANKKYTIGKIAYVDKMGNAAKDINFAAGTKHGAEFYIDNTPPTAQANLNIYSFKNESPTEIKLPVNSNEKYIGRLSTFFDDRYKSQFILRDIKDNLTGINAIEYFLSSEPIDENELSKIGWCSSKNSFADKKSEDVNLKVEDNGSQTLTISLPKPESSSAYYIYYHIADNTQNEIYMNGAGIILDQDEPIIQISYELEKNCVRPEKITEEANTIDAFTNDIDMNITVEEEHFDKENSTIIVEKYQTSGDKKGTYSSVLEVSGNSWDNTNTFLLSFKNNKLFTEQNKANQYKITVKAHDKVGHSTESVRLVRIDKEKPVVTIQYNDSNENKAEDYYYKKERSAKISIQKTFLSSVDEEDFQTAIETGIVVKNEKNVVVTDIKKSFYTISQWDNLNQCYIVTYGKDAEGNDKDAIYEFSLEFADKLGNTSEVVYTSDPKDKNSFVIDRNAPQIIVDYEDNAKIKDYYYKGKRTATLQITDLSFTYAYNYNSDKPKILSNDNKKFNEAFVKLNIKAENPFDNNISLPKESEWNYNNGMFTKTISYEKDAVYTFGIDENGQDVCQNKINIIYGNGSMINDGKSFVIDSSIPVITVKYNDKNKQTNDYPDGYYRGTRTSEIEIKDLSLYYAKTTSSKAHQEYPLTESYIQWTIQANDIKNQEVPQAYETSAIDETGWIFDNNSFTFKRTISYNKDAIYEFSINGQDICGNYMIDENGDKKSAEIFYQKTENEKIENITDGESFVIDTQAPIITVTYYDNENNKLKDETGFIDHYYKDTRTAAVTVSDLSFAYAYKMQKIENPSIIPDVITNSSGQAGTDSEKIKWSVSARNEEGKEVENAYSIPMKWTFSEQEGSYTQEIEFYGEAIYEFSISGSDFCQNKAVSENVNYQAKDGNSFVLDRTAPKITVKYDDTNKQTDGYYKDNRTVIITISDLSYIYEELLEKIHGTSEIELTAARRVPIFITAQNALSKEVPDAYTDKEWTFSGGNYNKEIIFQKDAVYSFELLKERNAEGILIESIADIYGRTANISYINQSGVTVKDYASFVISREAPYVTVTYNDNAENKQTDYYYKDTRIAELTVSDLSYFYEDKSKENSSGNLAVSNPDKINIAIQAEDTKGIIDTSNYIVQGEWSFDSENGVYKKRIEFKEDAIYSLTISGSNIFEKAAQISYQNSEGEIKDGTSFVIDRQAPEITIIYDNSNKETNYYKNYFYSGERTARVEISDLSYIYEDKQRAATNLSGYVTADRITHEITARNEQNEISENAYTISEWSRENGVYINTIKFTQDGIYNYFMRADDIYGNSINKELNKDTITITYKDNHENEVADWGSFVIDTTAPIVSVTYDDRNKGTNTTKQEYTNGYYKDNRTAHITVSDLSFFYADKYMPDKEDIESLVLNRTDYDENSYILPNITAYSNDFERAVENAHTMNLETLWSWNEAQNGYKADITFMAEANYSFGITGEDICKNTANVNYSDVADANRFVIDKTSPEISIAYNDNSAVRVFENRGYFSRTRTATIVITEGCDTFDTEDARNNIIITARDAAGNDISSDTYTVSGWTESKAVENGVATRYTSEITYRGDANYTFEISYTDKTGHTASNINTNNSTTPYIFTVDSGAPTGIVSVSGFGSWNSLAELLTFDRWTNNIVNITASADDRISSVYSVKYYKTAAVTAMTRQQLLNLNDSLWTDYSAFSVTPDEMFSVYLRVEDRSGNISFISSDGIIVDATAPNEESIAPEITVAPVQPVNNIYNTDVTVDITVIDPIVNGSYSGLKNVRYEVWNMGLVTQQGQLYTFSYTTGQTLQSQLLQRWNGQITVDRNLNNSNDVRIVVYAEDNSNNTSNAYTAIQIDVTQPSIDISYDNNNGDTSFGTSTYFNADRTATISITERNFNADNVQVTVTNTDGVIPSVSGWSSFTGTGNGDDTVHTATITYSADGDYTFMISYADLAGNVNTAVNYGNSIAPEQFTVDKTLPIINVTYDNNSMQNENYYNAARTATISITEHNFDAGRYNITLTASDNGTDKPAPSIGGWSNNGDIHTASIQFTDDGYYSINMSYTDMAGNQAAQFAQQTFYVDKKGPEVKIQGIKSDAENNNKIVGFEINNKANNNEIIGLEITCTDTNFDVFTPSLTMTKMTNQGNVKEEYGMQMTPIENGQVYTVDNLEQDGIYSLTCIARDKAGNVFNKVIYLNKDGQEADSMEAAEGISILNFSVNRDGSAHQLEPYSNEIVNHYYVREIDKDLVIVETNVDTVSSYIELNGKKLVEGTDYQVEISGGNGEWYVMRYIIHKELFDEEGEYKIVIYSEDRAGNIAYSDIKGTNISFVVDKTAPMITVAGIENNGRYQVQRQTVTVIPKDDGGKLQEITIEAFDQNGDMLNGFPIVYKGEELLTLLEENSGELTFELPEGTGMGVRITCKDTAGNEMDVMSFDNIVVSTNRLTIILSDRRFIYGAIIGILVLTALVVLLIVWRKHKKKQGKEEAEQA